MLQKQGYPSWQRIVAALARGRQSSLIEANDLLQSFIADRLPALARRLLISPVADESAYLRVSLRYFVLDEFDRQARYERGIETLRSALEFEPGPSSFAESVPSIADAVWSELSGRNSTAARAARLYLLGGTENETSSIRAIASRLKVSRHGARKALVEGLLGLAVLLGVHGELTAREVDAVRRVILDGRTPATAAEILGITTNDVRRSLARARAVVERSMESTAENPRSEVRHEGTE